MGLKIEKLNNIIISLERVVVAKVGKVVLEPRIVIEVQERQVWMVVEKQVQVLQ